MQRHKISLALFFIFAIAITGCAKKTTQQASISGPGAGTGFDSVSSTEELAQLPQSGTTNSNPQGGVEALPVETSPVTQGAPLPAGQAATSPSSAVSAASDAVVAGALNHEQKIQTALKNAGFYNGPVDGKIGPGSKKAIEAFQKSNGLKVDGKVGPKTWAALETHLADHAPAAGAAAVTADANSQ